MNIIRKNDMFMKEKKDVQRSINMSIRKLKQRLEEYQKQNISPDRVFNDDITKHDVINNCFYVYKCKVNQMQIRILYTVENDNVVIVSHYYKNRTNNDSLIALPLFLYFVSHYAFFGQKVFSPYILFYSSF